MVTPSPGPELPVARLEDRKPPVRMVLAALWASTMFCYLYCDYFELYTPGKLQGMLEGRMGSGTVSEGVLAGVSLMMAIPSLLVALSLLLPAGLCRWTNLVFGAAFTVLMAWLALQDHWLFYRGFAALEAALTATVVVQAWRWPRRADDAGAARMPGG